MKTIHLSLLLPILAASCFHVLASMPDWEEDGHTIGCAWAKDILGAKFIPGKGTPTVNLDIYEDNQGKRKVSTMVDDHHTFFAVAKKGPYVKLKMDLNGRVLGWAKENQLFFGPLRNCN
jgi:hypothetical protein